MTEIKVCGMMSEADVRAASGADYVGFILHTNSRRCVSIPTARKLMSAARQKKVIVTTLRDIDGIADMAEVLRPDAVQAHSIYSREDMERLSRSLACELWLLLPVGKEILAETIGDLKRSADKVVLDTPSAQGGGAGRTHDWEISAAIGSYLRPTGVVLAGGLSPGNVRDAIRAVRPDIVDVSSGVEENGTKSARMIEEFIGNARTGS